MNVVIYGKEGCVDCNKAKLLCQMKSVDFEYLTVGSDITPEKLEEQVGAKVASVPQIFLMKDGEQRYVGGYNELRQQL
ncbi:MAG TPA: glutaredoxin domain-containing protein [Alcanivoracaceae bacterium]|nr:glutaredoxin domain-containing protein [Alcanivoracaceae bacterium]